MQVGRNEYTFNLRRVKPKREGLKLDWRGKRALPGAHTVRYDTIRYDTIRDSYTESGYRGGGGQARAMLGAMLGA